METIGRVLGCCRDWELQISGGSRFRTDEVFGRSAWPRGLGRLSDVGVWGLGFRV